MQFVRFDAIFFGKVYFNKYCQTIWPRFRQFALGNNGKMWGRVGHLVRGLATLCCGSGYGNGSEEVSPCHWGRRVAGCVVEIIVANLIPPSCSIQKIQRVARYPSLRNWVVRGEIEQKTSKTTKSLLSFGKGKTQRICNKKQTLNL